MRKFRKISKKNVGHILSAELRPRLQITKEGPQTRSSFDESPRVMSSVRVYSFIYLSIYLHSKRAVDS